MSRDILIEFNYKPLPMYEPFHRSLAPERCLFGGFGSGKSYALCAEALAFGLENPGARIMLTRLTYPELRDTLEPIFMELMPPELFDASKTSRTGGHYDRVILPNGTTFLFRSIDDWTKHKSMNLAAIFWDELNEFSEETYLGMMGRLRQREPTAEAMRLGVKQIHRRVSAAATNSGGRDWVWQRFVSDKRAQSTEHYVVSSLENPFLPPEYLKSLLSFPEPWVKRYVLCTFDAFSGQIYEDWNWNTHVINPLPPERVSKQITWMGFDPGTRHPSACLWVVVDRQTGGLVGIAEYQKTYLEAQEHARAWRQTEASMKMNVKRRIADPSISVTDRGSNMTLRDQYQRLGFNFELGPKQHNDRIPMLGQMIKQGRFKVTKDCPMAFNQIRDYRWQDLTPQQRAKGDRPDPEKPVKVGDDLVDAAQYICSRYVKPDPLTVEKIGGPDMSWSGEIHELIRKQLKRKRAPRSSIYNVIR